MRTHDDLPDDERVAGLPAWARKLIDETRSIARHAVDQADEARQAARVARRDSAPADSVITFDGADGNTYGLPGVEIVNFGDVSVTVTAAGLEISAVHQLVVLPRSQGDLIVRSTR